MNFNISNNNFFADEEDDGSTVTFYTLSPSPNYYSAQFAPNQLQGCLMNNYMMPAFPASYSPMFPQVGFQNSAMNGYSMVSPQRGYSAQFAPNQHQGFLTSNYNMMPASPRGNSFPFAQNQHQGSPKNGYTKMPVSARNFNQRQKSRQKKTLNENQGSSEGGRILTSFPREINEEGSRILRAFPREINNSQKQRSYSTLSSPKHHLGSRNGVYSFGASPRGYCLVININNFTDVRVRLGSQQDVENIKRCFEKFNFDVQIRKNLSSGEILHVFELFSGYARNSAQYHDCFVAFILSHGTMKNGSIFVEGSNCSLVNLDDIQSKFKPDRCPALARKPKLFFLSCCLGESPPRGVNVETDAVVCSDILISNEQDFLTGYSTVPGKVSLRDPNEGTWYVVELTRIFLAHHTSEHLQEMLNRVHDAVCQRKAGNWGGGNTLKIVPHYRSTLRGPVWF